MYRTSARGWEVEKCEGPRGGAVPRAVVQPLLPVSGAVRYRTWRDPVRKETTDRAQCRAVTTDSGTRCPLQLGSAHPPIHRNGTTWYTRRCHPPAGAPGSDCRSSVAAALSYAKLSPYPLASLSPPRSPHTSPRVLDFDLAPDQTRLSTPLSPRIPRKHQTRSNFEEFGLTTAAADLVLAKPALPRVLPTPLDFLRLNAPTNPRDRRRLFDTACA